MNSNPLLSTCKSVVKVPLYVAQIFTGTKSFSSHPVIGSRILNILGLHVFRTVTAAMITRFRQFSLRGFVSAEQREAYLRDGYLLIENYLPQEHFQSLNSEIRGLRGEVRECVQGDTLTQRVLLNDDVLSKMPACQRLLGDKGFSRLLRFAASRNSSPIYYVQSIKSNVISGPVDPQRTLHSDTFHSTMKAWLFLDNVSDHNGPFTYVPGSQKLSFSRLKWEYKNSIKGSTLANSYAARGSLRVGDEELEAMGMQQPLVCRVPANTLVIANTNGFHRRGMATEISNRMEVWAYSRTNPFNPFPGVNSNWYKRISHYAIEKFLLRQDQIAEAKGAVASWHLVGENALHEMPSQPKKVSVKKKDEEKTTELEVA